MHLSRSYTFTLHVSFHTPFSKVSNFIRFVPMTLKRALNKTFVMMFILNYYNVFLNPFDSRQFIL